MIKHQMTPCEFDVIFQQEITLKRDILYRHIAHYNKARDVKSVGVHKFRHTFAKQWIVSGGSVVTLSKILGHSNIGITDKYINMLVDDIKKNVDEVDILSKFSKERKRLATKKCIKSIKSTI